MKLPHITLTRSNEYFILHVTVIIITTTLHAVAFAYDYQPYDSIVLLIGGIFTGYFLRAFEKA